MFAARLLLIAALLLPIAISARVSHRSARSGPPRSTAAKNSFKRQQPCPATGRTYGPRKGYVIDHVRPLACGGADSPSNMQWQTNGAGKAKDKVERKSCR